MFPDGEVREKGREVVERVVESERDSEGGEGAGEVVKGLVELREVLEMERGEIGREGVKRLVKIAVFEKERRN